MIPKFVLKVILKSTQMRKLRMTYLTNKYGELDLAALLALVCACPPWLSVELPEFAELVTLLLLDSTCRLFGSLSSCCL